MRSHFEFEMCDVLSFHILDYCIRYSVLLLDTVLYCIVLYCIVWMEWRPDKNALLVSCCWWLVGWSNKLQSDFVRLSSFAAERTAHTFHVSFLFPSSFILFLNNWLVPRETISEFVFLCKNHHIDEQEQEQEHIQSNQARKYHPFIFIGNKSTNQNGKKGQTEKEDVGPQTQSRTISRKRRPRPQTLHQGNLLQPQNGSLLRRPRPPRPSASRKLHCQMYHRGRNGN